MFGFFKEKSGATMSEYAVIAGLIALICSFSVSDVGAVTRQTFCKVAYGISDELTPGCKIKLTDFEVGRGFESTGLFLKAGQTVEVQPEGDWTVSQYDGKKGEIGQNDPFNGVNHLSPDRPVDFSRYGFSDAKGRKSRLSVFGAQISRYDGKGYETNYLHNPSRNMSFAQNGKLTITAHNDGYLYVGVHDSMSRDNTFRGDIPKVNIYLTDE